MLFEDLYGYTRRCSNLTWAKFSVLVLFSCGKTQLQPLESSGDWHSDYDGLSSVKWKDCCILALKRGCTAMLELNGLSCYWNSWESFQQPAFSSSLAIMWIQRLICQHVKLALRGGKKYTWPCLHQSCCYECKSIVLCGGLFLSYSKLRTMRNIYSWKW